MNYREFTKLAKVRHEVVSFFAARVTWLVSSFHASPSRDSNHKGSGMGDKGGVTRTKYEVGFPVIICKFRRSKGFNNF